MDSMNSGTQDVENFFKNELVDNTKEEKIKIVEHRFFNVLLVDDVGTMIQKRISRDELDHRLAKGVKSGIIPGEQIFRDPLLWYQVSSYANPYKTPHEELRILYENAKEISNILVGNTKCFYGVGVGDTEVIPITWDLELNYDSEIYAVDAFGHFLETFAQGLKNLALGYPNQKVLFLGDNNLFEHIHRKNLLIKGKKYDNNAFICFGNTIGNFEQTQIFNIFKRNATRNDLLILGYQLSHDIRRLKKEYEDNIRFRQLLSQTLTNAQSSLSAEWERYIKKSKIKWKIDYSTMTIQAFMNGVILFRSKKYNEKEVPTFAKQYGFSEIKSYYYKDSAITILKKI